MNKVHVRRDDTVIVISGDDKGAKGKVIAVSPDEHKGVNVQTKHMKPRKQGEAGGVIKVEGAMHADKVALYCSNCKAGRRSKIKVENGKKIRVCAKCGQKI